MSEQSCTACNDLREYAPEFVVNGVTDSVCAHLANNEGLSGADGHEDCDDLHDVNDCLIGNLEDEIDAYEVCDWKDYLLKLVPNLYETLKAIICSICGLWAKVKELICKVNYLFNGLSLGFTQEDFISGKDVTFSGAIPLNLYVRGSTYRFHGSVTFDLDPSYTISGETVGWGTIGRAPGTLDNYVDRRINTTNQNWTIAILKIKKANYPEIKQFFTATGMTTNNACAFIDVVDYDEGESYPGQWGSISSTATVPAGYRYVRISLSNAVTWGGNAHSVTCTFNSTGMVDINAGKVKC